MNSDIRRDDFLRDVMLDVEKDGTITYRSKADLLPEGCLPFFSVHTGEDAEQLILRLCKRQYALHPRTRAAHYRYVGLGSERDAATGLPLLGVDDINRLADIFRNAWFDMREKAALAASNPA